MRTTVSTFVVAACMCIMAVGGVNIDQYYCSKFGDATVYGQFYVVGGEDGVPQKPFDSLMLLLSSLLNETDEDTYSYSSGSLPPTTTCGFGCLQSYDFNITAFEAESIKDVVSGKKVGFTGVPVALERPLENATFACESETEAPESGFSRIVLKVELGCSKGRRHSEWENTVKCKVEFDTSYGSKGWPSEDSIFEETVELHAENSASALSAFVSMLVTAFVMFMVGF